MDFNQETDCCSERSQNNIKLDWSALISRFISNLAPFPTAALREDATDINFKENLGWLLLLFTLACSSSEYWVQFLLCESFVLNSEFSSYFYFISILDNLSCQPSDCPQSRVWVKTCKILHIMRTSIFPYFRMNFIQFESLLSHFPISHLIRFELPIFFLFAYFMFYILWVENKFSRH